jgi:hypothetical protein
MLILLLTLTSISGFCQITSVWKGKTPGHEAEWSFVSKWGNNRVPDEFTDVVIPADITLGNNYPVIRAENVEINSLCIRSGAQIRIETRELTMMSTEGSHFQYRQVTGIGKVNFREDAANKPAEWTSLQDNQ